MTDTLQTAAFAAGCFWAVEEMFRTMEGVVETKVGYMGGTMENPTYEDVCMGETGHAETVRVHYDPSIVSYEALLQRFWEIHDPTEFNRQGPDEGTQYRSVIFYHTPEQERVAIKSRGELDESGKYKKPIVTEIVPASTFYPAEEYHQKYLAKHGLSSCPI